jgi:hypothetical protein
MKRYRVSEDWFWLFGVCVLFFIFVMSNIQSEKVKTGQENFTKDALKVAMRVDTVEAREALFVASNLFLSSKRVGKTPLHHEHLADLVDQAFHNHSVNVRALVDFERLIRALNLMDTEKSDYETNLYVADVF